MHGAVQETLGYLGKVGMWQSSGRDSGEHKNHFTFALTSDVARVCTHPLQLN